MGIMRFLSDVWNEFLVDTTRSEILLIQFDDTWDIENVNDHIRLENVDYRVIITGERVCDVMLLANHEDVPLFINDHLTGRIHLSFAEKKYLWESANSYLGGELKEAIRWAKKVNMVFK